ncbi:MAG: hypothetical protein ACXACY_10335 [Candidatus Hodarchaeales archaeon]|jgi:hypothetical protein
MSRNKLSKEYAEEWLAKHSNELSLPSQSKKSVLIQGNWIVPQCCTDNLGVFKDICDQDSFNRIVGDPNNWNNILSNDELFEKWILPHAVVLFGKPWFDRVKWRQSIHRGIPFPLFSESERTQALDNNYKLEDMSCGKAKIAKIIGKMHTILHTYLRGKWYEEGIVKIPGRYIVDSIKNEFIRDIGKDLGFKSVCVPICPFCLSGVNGFKKKTLLERYSNEKYSCPTCIELSDNLRLQLKNLYESSNGDESEVREVEELCSRVEQFKRFVRITCVCPSQNCPGKFVPITCVDYRRFSRGRYNIRGALKDFNVGRNIQCFKDPPKKLLDFPLVCPYCNEKFTPRTALERKSGFKGKSGYLTGVPSMKIWDKRELLSGNLLNDCIVDKSFSDINILYKQRVGILISEIIIQMSMVDRKRVNGLITWYFYLAVILWMRKYLGDANRYFFSWSTSLRDLTCREKEKYPDQDKRKVTNVIRGRENSIHRVLFYIWMDLLESHIKEFRRIDDKIRRLRDFGWFAREPKFSGGPRSVFISSVNKKNCITNRTPIKDLNSRIRPRLARIYGIYKIIDGDVKKDYNYVEDIKICEWNTIRLKQSSELKLGDEVSIDSLVMSGHSTHAPIKRILRLRSVVLKNIISRILAEEETGSVSANFWKHWKQNVVVSKKKTGIDIEI